MEFFYKKSIIIILFVLITFPLYSQYNTMKELSDYSGGYFQIYKEEKGRRIFRTIFKSYMPPMVNIYITAGAYSHSNNHINSITGNKFEKAILETNDFNVVDWYFNIDFYFTEFNNLKWGLGTGTNRSKYKAKLFLTNYSDFFFTTDKDSENYYKYVYSKEVNENIKFINWNIPITLNLRISLLQEILDLTFKVGVKFSAYNILNIKYAGIFTYEGVYERYGGEQFPLHDIERYGFVSNYNLGSEIREKIKQEYLLQPFSSVGVSFFVKDFKILASFSYDLLKSGYKNNVSEISDYYISEDIENHNSIFLTRKITGDKDFYFGLGLTYHITNKKIMKRYHNSIFNK